MQRSKIRHLRQNIGKRTRVGHSGAIEHDKKCMPVKKCFFEKNHKIALKMTYSTASLGVSILNGTSGCCIIYQSP